MEAIELKKTVNLPRTEFPMKANLGQLETKLLSRWDGLRNLRADSRRP